MNEQFPQLFKEIIWLHHTDMHVITYSAKGADARKATVAPDCCIL